MRKMIMWARGLLAAMVAGALAGAVVGIAESVLVIATSAPPEEYWLVLFGVAAYGGIGIALAAAAAVAWQLIRRGQASERALAQIGIAAGLTIPVLAVARYHIAQRLFAEQLPIATPTGLVVHGLIALGALLVVLAGIGLVRACYRTAGLAVLAGAVAALAVAAALVGVVAGAGAQPGPVAPRAAAPAARPNVILIVVDTLRADAAEAVRNASGGSTGFAQLARDGVVFDRTYAQASWTRPSIASILTSTYPSTHHTIEKMDFLPDSAVTLAEVLKAQGYWTAAFTTNINVAPIFNFQQGFDDFHYLEPSFYFGASDSATRLAVYKGLRAAREKLTSAMWVENYYQDAAVVDRNVAAWLAQAPPEPFFLFIHYMDPHDPYFDIPYDGHGVARVSTPEPAPGRVAELRGIYDQDVRYLDGYLQRLIERLKADRLYDRSVVAVTADHGEEFYEHGGWWHGTDLYDEQVHVPLIIKRAREPEPARHRGDVARSIDIGPTLVAAAGGAVPDAFQGIDLFTATVSEPVIAEEELEGNRLTSIRSGNWKLITANRDNPRGLPPTALFDLAADPDERTNLAANAPDTVTALLAELDHVRTRVASRRGAGGGGDPTL